jgi:hypothetical protein
MKQMVKRFYEFIERPLFPASRFILLLALVPLVASFFAPLWRISLVAPQYPDGLFVDVFSYAVRGGNNGQHLTEINTINHYIGMRHIDRAMLADLDWMPFAIGILGLLAARVALIGNVRSLIDLSVLSVYVSGFAFARFYAKMYSMGHDLDPAAPLHIQPFTPPVFGTREIANFTSSSYPRIGSLWLGLFLAAVVGLMLWHLVAGAVRAWRRTASGDALVKPLATAAAVIAALAILALPRTARACDVCAVSGSYPAADPTLAVTGTDTGAAGHARFTVESATTQRRIGREGVDAQAVLDSRVTLGAAWTPWRYLTVSAAIPGVYRNFTDAHGDRYDSFGLGDAQVIARVYAFRDDRWSSATSLSFSAGLKMPTAPWVLQSNGYASPQGAQTGTGTWDPSIGATVSHFGPAWSVVASVRATWPLTTRDDSDAYVPGRTLSASVAPQYRIVPTVAVVFGWDAWLGEPDRGHFGIVANTGGFALFTSPTVLVNVTPSLLLRATVQVPVANAYLGMQRDSPGFVLAGTYSF